jgi:hypothetical protein
MVQSTGQSQIIPEMPLVQIDFYNNMTDKERTQNSEKETIQNAEVWLVKKIGTVAHQRWIYSIVEYQYTSPKEM